MVITNNIQAVLSELGVQLNIADLQFDEDQSCFVAFDEQAINIQLIKDKLYLTTHVTTLANEASPALYEALLQANLYGVVTNGAIIALEPESRAILLQDVIEGAICTVDYLISRLENLLATTQLLTSQIAEM